MTEVQLLVLRTTQQEESQKYECKIYLRHHEGDGEALILPPAKSGCHIRSNILRYAHFIVLRFNMYLQG